MIEHDADKVCDCKYCLMITIMYGDPKLNSWEDEFVTSVSEAGWQGDYTDKQKKKIEQIFDKQRKLYMAMVPL